VAENDDDLDQIPWWDAKALRMADAIERSIVRLHLESQGEFVAIMNAIAMQLESHKTVPEVVRLLGESLRTLAAARGIEERHRRRLDQRLDELFQRVKTVS
jgi:hypothetical protein